MQRKGFALKKRISHPYAMDHEVKPPGNSQTDLLYLLSALRGRFPLASSHSGRCLGPNWPWRRYLKSLCECRSEELRTQRYKIFYDTFPARNCAGRHVLQPRLHLLRAQSGRWRKGGARFASEEA